MLDLTEVLRRNVIIKDGFIDLNNVLFNPYILKLYQRRVKDVFSDLPINKVLTAATDGIPPIGNGIIRIKRQVSHCQAV